MQNHLKPPANTGTTLVLGGTGKTGRRIAERLHTLGIDTRIGSRSALPSFDWQDDKNWHQVLEGVTSVYISFAPDLAIPGATKAIQRFVDLAVKQGVKRLVLLSGRGEAEAQACEQVVQATDIEWTIVRASWFMQNFSEGEFLDMIRNGAITLPAADIPEPFIDVNDIADVAVAALTEEGHAYEVYEVTGPRLLTFTQVADEISDSIGREIQYIQVPQDALNQAIKASGAPEEIAWLLNYLFETVLDGRNASLGDGVQKALGRQPADFRDFAQSIATQGCWHPANTKQVS
ncbi:NAD(P)H-binding protein [Marinobacterium stanieri]|uniref:NmrA family NAD(P)-binding protein n=1 Tax=Marinobacterium stanieri TaxID=49186 RepID=UPI003A8D2A0C